MIDKITPKFLDKSSDFKLVRKTSLIDALNIYIDTETGDDNSGGVIKPIKGTQAIFSYDEFAEDTAYKAIGSVTDENTGIVYFFVWSEDVSKHSIWAYDSRPVLPDPNTADDSQDTPFLPPYVPSIKKIIEAPELNFSSSGFVKGDIVYTGTREFDKYDDFSGSEYPEKDAILYFTDNKNEPRKINVYRAYLEGFQLGANSTVEDQLRNRQIRRDFICACPRVPMAQPEFEFVADSEIKINNFLNVPGFQFAYQNVYQDGAESAISPYSDIAFPPSVLEKGASKSDNSLADNKCIISIPPQNQEVKLIKILARYGNGSNFVEIDEVENETPDSVIDYDFLNNTVFGGVSPQTVDKTFDNVPQKAQSQVVTSNRIAYGNYVEGYDNVDCSGVNLEPVYLDRPNEILDFEITIKESVEMAQNQGLTNNGSKQGRNKVSGFTYTKDQFPDSVGANTRIRVSFSMAPDRNFHIYSAGDLGEADSYHQSKHLGNLSLNLPGYNTGNEGQPAVNPTSPADAQESGSGGEPGHFNEREAGAQFLSDEYENYFGYNDGVGDIDSNNSWIQTVGTTDGEGGVSVGGQTANQYKLVYGTSAANPLIIQGGNIPFSVDFTINSDIASGAREVIGKSFEFFLAGKSEIALNSEFGDEGLVSLNEVNRSYELEIDLGLDDYSVITQGSSLSNLICGAKCVANNFQVDRPFYLRNAPPSCAFIINRATATFYLESVITGGESQQDGYRSNARGAFRLCVASIEVPDSDAVLTCIRDLDPRSPWWTVKPSTMENDFPSNLNSIIQNELSPSNRVFHPNTSSPKKNFVANFPTSYRFENDGFNFVVTPSGTFLTSNINPLTGNNLQPGDVLPGPGGTSITIPSVVSGILTANPPILSEDPHAETVTVMANCFGYLNVSAGDNILGKTVDINNLSSSGEFEYSMADGEGGPGGSGAGQGTAYDILGNDKYGSLAGQCFVDQGLNLGTAGEDVGGGSSGSSVNGSIDHRPSDGYNVYAAGSTEGGIGNTSLQYLKDAGVAAALNGDDLQTPLPIDPEGSYPHTSVLCGPFYTGRIVMNNFNGNNIEAANVNPSGTRIRGKRSNTTTLPLVWFCSWLRGQRRYPAISEQGDALGNVGVFDDEDPYIVSIEMSSGGNNNRQTWYPHPIVLGLNDGGTGGFVDDELASGQVISDPFGVGYNSVDYTLNQSHIEMGQVGTSFEDETRGSGTSFKSSASHDFGIVYYDERGRHGFVNPIGSVYVAGYNTQERGSNAQGAVNMKVSNITHTPPSWAKNYKIVYSKNTSIDKFIQYSSGGAFVKKTTSDNADQSIIYVSLNYLQGHPISYSDSYGARGRDNTPVLYSFTPGDRLRVISHFLSASGDNVVRNFPSNVEFEVTGLFSFDENDNPFVEANDSDVEVKESMKGLFIGLKNNQDAQGFRYQDVRDDSDLWGNNCIFEIFSPKKQADSDDRLYYEIGQTYPIVYGGAGVEGQNAYHHKLDEVILTQGDVFFRKHAVNLREFDETLQFVDLLEDNSEDNEVFVPDSNFKNYYLESEAASDLFPSRAISIGRPNIVKADATQSRRESSIVHSDKDIVEARKLGYSSFNRSIPSDMEIDIKAGAINYMTNHQDSIFFVQKNKCGHIPVDRNLISDTSGSSSLIASSKFLGTPRYYSGHAGCDDNPESVVDIDNTAYFAHKSLGKVFKVNGANGVNVISDINMSTFIRNAFKDAISNAGGSLRILGGYDPLKKEYLLTISENDPSLIYTPLSPIVEEETFTPGSEMGSDVGISIDGGLFDGDEEIVEERFGEVRIDWSLASNLDNAQWSLNYQPGSVSNPGANNLQTANSAWKTKDDGINVNIEQNLSLRITVNNRDLLTNQALTFNLDKNLYDNLSLGTGFTLSTEDNNSIALIKEKIADESVQDVDLNDSTLLDILENDFPSCFRYGNPNYSDPVNLADRISWNVSDDQQTASLVINNDDTWPAAAPNSFYVDIPIIAVSQVGDSLLRSSWFVGNMGTVRLVRESQITISTDGFSFKVGNTPNNNSSRTLPLKATATWLPSAEYNDLRDVVNAGDGVFIPFNPCNPVYGLYSYTEDDGTLTAISFLDWLADGGAVAWLEYEGFSGVLTEEQEDAVQESLQNILSQYSTEPLGCLISSIG